MKTAYIVKAYRTAVGKAPKGVFRFKRTDELAAETIKYMMEKLPSLDPKRIDDVIVGNAMPEGAQGLNMARLISLMGLDIVDVPGEIFKNISETGEAKDFLNYIIRNKPTIMTQDFLNFVENIMHIQDCKTNNYIHYSLLRLMSFIPKVALA